MLFERIGLEAQRTLDAFDRQYGFMTVSKLLVAVPAAAEGFLEALGACVYVPFERMDLGQVIDFADGKAQLVAVKAYYGGPLIGQQLRQLREHMPNVDTRVAAIFRRDRPITPRGDTIIEADDNLAAQLRVNDLIEPVTEIKVAEPEIVKVAGPEIKKRGRPAKNASNAAD